ITDSDISDNQSSSTYAGVRVSDSSLTMRNSLVANNGYGLYALGANTIQLVDNTIIGNRCAANVSNASGFVAVGNTWGHSTGNYGLRLYNVAAPTITGNTFSDNSFPLLLAGNMTSFADIHDNIWNNNVRNGYVLNLVVARELTLSAQSDAPYVIDAVNGTHAFLVDSGGILTIEAGAIFKLDGWDLYLNGGTLNVQGTPDNPVYFTSIKDDSVGGDTNNDGYATSPVPGDWRNIQVNSTGHATFDHAEIRFGGSYAGLGSALYVDAGTLQLTNSKVTDNGYAGSGAGAIGASNGALLTITDSDISDNQSSSTYAGVRVSDSSLTMRNSLVANNGYGLYALGANTIQLVDNTIIGNRCAANVSNASGFVAVGNTWGHSTGNYGLRLYNVAAPTITGNTFSDNSFPLLLAGNMTSFADIHDNIWNNNVRNGYVLNLVVARELTLSAQSDAPYVIDAVNGTHAFLVDSGGILTIEAGAIFKLDGWDLYLNGGTLNVQGTPDNPVYFTSIKDDSVGGDTNNDGYATSPVPGDWRNIQVNSTGHATFDHAEIRFGGSYAGLGSALYVDGGTLQLTNSKVTDNGYAGSGAGAIGASNGALLTITDSDISDNQSSSTYAGVRVSDSSLTLQGNMIAGNRYGVYLQNPVMIDITGNRIQNNAVYGIYNAGVASVDAQDNWWGTSSGPRPYGSGNGINYTSHWDSGCQCTVIDAFLVNTSPWLGQDASNGGSIPWQAFEADPVNTATGNYAYQYSDLSLPTRSLPLEVRRSYNSTTPLDGPLGFGWSHHYLIQAVRSSTDEAVTVRFGDGHTERYVWDGIGYVPPAGSFSSLEKIDGLLHLTLKDQSCYQFDTFDRLTTISDPNGNVTDLDYSDSQLSTVTAPDGRMLVFHYDGSHRLIAIEDLTGRRVEYGYDGAGNLTAVTDTLGFVTTMSYDSDHQLLTITDANGHTFVDNTYNADGRVVEQRDADGNLTTFVYDIPNHRTLVTDPLGRQTVYQYDADLRLLSKTDALGNVESYTYDAANNRTSVTDKRGHTAGYSYDLRGNLLRITDTLGFVTTYSYDSYNNLLSATEASGATSSYSYDANHNLLSATDPLTGITSFSYDGLGQLTSSTDALGNSSLFVYDLYGHQTRITNALGFTSVYTYDVAGRLLAEQDPLGRVTTYGYDNANRLLASTDPFGNSTGYGYDPVGNNVVITSTRGAVTALVYDAKDRLVNIIDPLGRVMTYTYDAVNNRTSLIDPLGRATQYGYDALNRRTGITDALGFVTTFGYDANGNRTTLTDANGNTTTFVYDERNLLVSVTDAAGGTVNYSYDANGNRLSMTDANSHVTQYGYDPLDRLLTVTDPLSQTVSYVYDPVGNRIATARADGTMVSYGYDALYQLTSTSYPSETVQYSYDAIGNRLVMTDTLGVTAYSYDLLSRPVAVLGPDGVVGYGYDSAGNRTQLIYPDGRVVTYTYDLANQMTLVEDWAGRLTIYAYDDAGQLITTLAANGVQTMNSYDDAGRLLAIQHVSPVSGTIAFFTYTLDAVGNRLVMTDTDGVTNYDYDVLYRLTDVDYPDGEQVDYAYDSMGNRTTMTSTVTGVTSYTYDASDRLLDAGGLPFTWDANGNQQSKGSVAFSFDALDRLLRVISGTTTVDFDYNGDGVRLGKAVNGVPTSYVQDMAAPLPVVLSETTAGQTVTYVYGLDLLYSVDVAGDGSYYLANGLGSTKAMTNDAGQLTDAYSYDAFGAIRNNTGPPEQSITFTGEQLDAELGLIFLRARYYDPKVGRFVSRDGFPGFPATVQGRNRYIYALNNPTANTDPTGYFALSQYWSEFGRLLRSMLGINTNPPAQLSEPGSPFGSLAALSETSGESARSSPFLPLLNLGKASDPANNRIEAKPNAPANNCVEYVGSYREHPTGNPAQWTPDSVASQGFRSGTVPRVSALMVEGPNPSARIGSTGHTAIVAEVRPDGSFLVYEGNWDGGFNQETFWPDGQGGYTNRGQSNTGSRRASHFVY
ncbi:MAG: right-handed parallel beta-helix repeat-containing protein, partial [Anaerolineae bacterium]|nr:right-handed parallel beta-helix repeat-containing protein [Anaerolineae bacterium]